MSLQWARKICQIVLVSLACATDAHAVGLGPIHVQSALGEPLKAVIALEGSDAGDYESRCIRSRVETFEGATISLAGSEVQRSGQSASIRVSTRQSINEPALKVSVRIICGGVAVHRDYQILLDPDLTQAEVPLAQFASPASAAAPAVRGPRKEHTSGRQAGKLTAETAATPLPAEQPRKSARSRKNANALRLSRTDAAAAEGTAALRLRLATALALSDEELLMQRLDDIQAKQARIAAALRETEQATASVPAARPAQEEGAALREENARLKQQAQSDKSAIDAIREESLFWIRGLGGMLLTCLGVMAWLLWRIRDVRRTENASAWDQYVDEVQDEAVDSYVADDAPPLPRSTQLVAEHHGPALATVNHTPKAEEVSDVMELVDVWMALNDPMKVLDLLKPFSESENLESPLPWLCLLDVYRSLGDEEKYEAIVSRIKKNFNVKLDSWHTGAAMTQPRTLGDFPHVIAKILSLWKSDELVPYLESLLRDGRAGTREGFDLPVYRDLLRLVALARDPARMVDDENDINVKAIEILSVPPALPPNEPPGLMAEEPEAVAPPAIPEPPSPPAPRIRERPKYITPSYERIITAGEDKRTKSDAAPRKQTPVASRVDRSDQGECAKPPCIEAETTATPPIQSPTQDASRDDSHPSREMRVPAVDEMSPMSIKLHLAIAYEDIGDREGALLLLQEVMAGGTEEQVSQASGMAERLTAALQA